MSAGFYHSCGIRVDGSVACWGDDTAGQASPPEGSFKSVSAGQQHTCGLRPNGVVECWGSNTDYFGEHVLGQATPPAGVFTSVSAGYTHTCGNATQRNRRMLGGKPPRSQVADNAAAGRVSDD